MGLTKGQKRCVETLDQPLVVAAGAGSGKTFTLTRRIVNALESGFVADIDQICAITFTKKAAGELKSRIKGALRASGMIEQALKVDEAWISTIHGACARILRAHALELGIDPVFSVADEAQLDDYLSAAIDTALSEAKAHDASKTLDALFDEYPAQSFAGSASIEGMVRQLVNAAAAQADGTGSFVLPGTTLSPARVLDMAVEIMEELIAAASEEKESAKRDEWLANASLQLDRARDVAGGEANPIEALEVLSSFKLAKTFGGKAYRSRVEEAKAPFGALVMELRLGAAARHLDTLVSLAHRALELFDDMKAADGVLDNNDLLVMAARAIEEHPDIRARYADKFKLVMVDEFQDTDQMQVDMVKRLSGPNACRLCVVGDAQQSIYRFRGADVSVYRRHLVSVKDQWPDGVIELSDNFRSHADVLSLVDRVFERPDVFGAEFMSLSPDPERDKRVAHPFTSAYPRIQVQHVSRPWRGVTGDYAIAFAASRIAQSFADLHEAGHSAGEMCILLGRMTNAEVYASALRDQGLSCVIAGGSVFASTLEANVVRELAFALANPGQTQSLFNVLTSPLFSLTADDVLRVGGVKGFWRAAMACQAGAPGPDSSGDEHPLADVELSPQLELALRVMGRARDSISSEAVSSVVAGVVSESGWLSRLEQQGAEGLAAAANAFKAIRMIESIEHDGATGPSSVACTLAEKLDHSKEAPGALSVSGGDSVKIMTIHASKGLEFPIVAVAEMREDTASTSKLLTTSLAGRVYLSLDLSRTLDATGNPIDAHTTDLISDYVLGLVGGEEEYAGLVKQDGGALHRRLSMRGYAAAGDEEEAKRLLYVALTRAREALVISMSGKRTKSNPAGLPNSAFAHIIRALGIVEEDFGPGSYSCDFRGTAPAVVVHDALEADDEAAFDRPAEQEVQTPFFVPAAQSRSPIAREPYKPVHDDVFSYSSIAASSHKGAVLSELADAFGLAADACADELQSFEAQKDMNVQFGGAHASFDEDDDFWARLNAPHLDEDRATDLGTAFHRLAQYAVIKREGRLSMPPADRFDSLARTCNLDASQRHRLKQALSRWFGSDVAREMEALHDVEPEVPFFIRVPMGEGAEHAYLEGEIDLLGFDAERKRAFVVDYKTGGSAGETADQLLGKHVLQASCYAYALLVQGAEEVQATFVRVERSREGDEDQPQCVRYRFCSSDKERLERSIVEAYRLA